MKTKINLEIPKLKINNMILTGQLPLKRKLKEIEINNLIEKGSLNWRSNEMRGYTSLQANIPLGVLKNNGKEKNICVTLWLTGNKITFVGVRSRKEAMKNFVRVIDDLIKIADKAF